MVSNEELRRKAESRAEEKIGFYVHLSIYIIVNLLLYIIWWVNVTFTAGSFKDKLAEKEYKKLKNK